jgi:paraquat-inducible protein A
MNAARKPPAPDLVACHQCDLLMALPPIAPGRRGHCIRCGALIRSPAAAPIEKPLALTAAALLFFLPANVLPMLELNIMGHASAATMVGAAGVLFAGGLPLVGLMVFCCSILVPFITMGLLFFTLASVAIRRRSMILPRLYRLYLHLDSWAMLEVYMIGLLVAIIKLLDMARVQTGIGLACFIGLLITSLAARAALDRDAVWEEIDALCRR